MACLALSLVGLICSKDMVNTCRELTKPWVSFTVLDLDLFRIKDIN